MLQELEEEEEAKGCCGGDSGGREDEHKERVPSSEKLCYWRLPRALLKPVYFYTSPVVKFDLHVASYTFFLLLLSYTALVGFYASTFEWQEIVLCLYVIAFLFDEVHQVCREHLFVVHTTSFWRTGTGTESLVSCARRRCAARRGSGRAGARCARACGYTTRTSGTASTWRPS